MNDIDLIREQIGREAIQNMDVVDAGVVSLLEQAQTAAIQFMDGLHERGVTRAEAIGIVQHNTLFAMLATAR